MRRAAFVHGFELQYKNISPKIVAEEYLENDNHSLDDYKIFCFNGLPKMIPYNTDRHNGLKMAYFDCDWNLLPLGRDNFEKLEALPERPHQLDEMLQVATKLAAGFDFVRVDLYLPNDGKVRFGEMTFTPHSGVNKWNSKEADLMLGEMLSLPFRV